MSIYLQQKLTFKKNILSLSFIALSLAIFTFLVGFLLFVNKLPLESDIPILKESSFDGVIVYTGGKYRLGTTALIIKNGFKGPVLISGVYPGTNLKQAFKKLSLDENQIQQINLDYSAISTVGNVTQTINWVKSNNLSNVLIITSYYHAPRTKLLLNKLTNTSVNFIIYPVFSNNASFKLLFKEYIKYLLFKFNYIISISSKSQLPY